LDKTSTGGFIVALPYIKTMDI